MRQWREIPDSGRSQEEQGTGLRPRYAGKDRGHSAGECRTSFHYSQVGTGANYSVYVVRDSEEEDVEEIEEYEMLDQVKIEYTE